MVTNRTQVHIVESTRSYEAWLGTQTRLVKSDLRLKHQRMAEAVFPFLRATFYRWMQLWPTVCPDLDRAPPVLGVGDLHVENYGTWRDIEGRLVWGVNDFDEAAQVPFTVDLVRLAASALLAIEAGHLSVRIKDACAVILDGYCKSLSGGGHPFVLEEEFKWLRQIALSELRDPVLFWRKMAALPRMTGEIPASVRDALERVLPERGLAYRISRRVAGLGSLGRVRLVAIAECHGSKVAREAKGLAPSSVHWARPTAGSSELMYQTIIKRAVRSPDPFVQPQGSWIVRRLSPDCSRIELNVLPRDRDELRLLFAMGWETANIHLGSPSALKPIRQYLNRAKPNWLSSAATNMSAAVTDDWRAWRESV
jgi:uncharacterized protein (DUF2252 family)